MKTIHILLVAFFATSQVQAQGIMLAGGAVEEEPPSFLPSDVSNLKAWYDANDMNGDGSSPGTPPATWVDKSSSGFDLARSGNPVFSTLNGKDVLQLTGSNNAAGDFYYGSSASDWTFIHDGSDNTIFIVATPSTLTSNINFLFATGTGGQTGTGIHIAFDDRASLSKNYSWFSVIARGQTGTVASITNNNQGFPVNTFKVYRIENDLNNSSSAYAHAIYGNNSFIAGQSSVDNSPSTNNPSNPLYIGGIAGTFFTSFTGYIAEVVIYDRLLTTQEITDVEKYLSTKYGL